MKKEQAMKIRKIKTILLAGVLMFESIFASVAPVAAQTISENGITAEESTVMDVTVSENAAAVSESEVTEKTSKSKTLPVQEEEVSPENATIKYSGTDGEINWSLDVNGHLTITGNGDYMGDPDWLIHQNEIISATVTVTNITSTYRMFYGCSSLTNLDVSKFDTSSVTDMGGMFFNCSSLTNLDVSKFDTSSVTYMDSMFYHCSSLMSLDLRGFNTSNVTNMNGMFLYCSSLTNLDVSKFDTSSVTNMGCMFGVCSSLTSLDLTGFNTSSVTNMNGMFGECSSLTSLDLTGFNTSNVTDMSGMFGECSSLTSLDLSSWNLRSLKNSDSMLYGMDALIRISLPQSPVEITLPGDFYEGENGTYTLKAYADSYCGKNGHTYSSPIFTWADDYSSATVYTECTREDCIYDIDDKHLQMDAVVTKETIQPTVKKEGATVYTATVVLDGKTYTDVKKISIPKLTAKPVGTSLKTSTTFYRVTKSGKTPEVAYMGPKNKKVKTVNIPATVKIGGVTYKVTSVATGALKNYKKLTQVTVGKNVTKIGKNAFYGCKKLKKIVIKGKNLKTVGKNAFKGIQKKAVIDVPNSKKKAYKKLFKTNTGFKKKTMKVK